MHDMENSRQQSVAGSQQPFMDDGSATLVPYFQDESVIFYLGDSLAVLPSLAENSMDACVTDPPYELGFMGKAWDNSGIAYNVDLWRLVFRALKPGAHLLAFGGSRTYHRMACAIEDAGFEIRDQIQWIYGSGFPKSLDVSKAIDKMNGDERPVIGTKAVIPGVAFEQSSPYATGRREINLTSAASAASAAWDGWGTALKPAHEPIVMARKPLEKGLTVAQNVLKWGTGAINVDGCRVEGITDSNPKVRNAVMSGFDRSPQTQTGLDRVKTDGRFPANVIHDGSDEVLDEFSKAGERKSGKGNGQATVGELSEGSIPMLRRGNLTSRSDSGTASRFFYCAKSSKMDRNEGCEDLDSKHVRRDDGQPYGTNTNTHRPDGSARKPVPPRENHHPTVKPTELMRYLCRMVTPPKGTVLDMFMGSGSTGKAAMLEGFEFIGIEKEAEYCEIAEKRINTIFTKEPLFQK